MILLVGLLMVASLLTSGGPSVDQASTEDSDYKAVTERDYALIAKDPEAHEGQRIIIYAVVTQADAAMGRNVIRADTSARPHRSAFDYGTNTVLAAADADAFADVIEGDRVQVFAEVAGSYSYDTQIGGSTTAPLLSVGVIKPQNHEVE